MIKKTLFFLLLCGALSCRSFAYSTSDAQKAFEEIVTTMNAHYYPDDFHGLDWEKITAETRQKITTSKSHTDAYKHISAMLSRLGASHLQFIPPGIAERKKRFPLPTGSPKQINFALEVIGQNWVVTKVVKNSDAWEAGLRPGWTVENIGQHKTNELFPPGDFMAYHNMRQTLQLFPRKTIRLELVREENGTKSVSWKLQDYRGDYDALGHVADAYDFEARLLDGDIAYIHFSVFLTQPIKKAVKAIKSFRDQNCKGLILDMRNNPGGIVILSQAIAKEFAIERYSLGTQTSRDSTLSFPVFPQRKPFRAPVVILINENSASTAEILASGMQAQGQAILVGRRSSGMALPSVLLSLKGGGIFQYPIADFKNQKGESVEGRGVKPDYPVALTAELLLKGSDPDIDKALQIIKSKNLQGQP